MTAPRAGWKGRAYFGTTKIASVTWTHTGGERQMQPVDELGDELVLDLPLQIVGGVITITGNYKLDSDDGQKLAAAYFASGEQITDLKLYTDYTSTPKVYLTPDPDFEGGGVASYVTVTNCRNVADDKSGIGTLSITMKLSGVMHQVGDTAVVGVSTVGIIDNTFGGGNTCFATLIGELISAGEETTVWPKMYFEYGTTTGYGVDTALQESDTEPQMFDEDTAADLLADTLYHYRAVAITELGVKYYGADRTFTTLDS